MMAGMPVSMLKKKLQMPRTMLATALPLVGALAKRGGETFGVIGAAAAPHALQNRPVSSMGKWHFGQYFMASLLKICEDLRDADSFLINLSALENKRFVCNCQMGAGKGQ